MFSNFDPYCRLVQTDIFLSGVPGYFVSFFLVDSSQLLATTV